MFSRIGSLFLLVFASSFSHADFVMQDGKYTVGACEVEVYKSAPHGLYEVRVMTDKGYNGEKKDVGMFNLAVEDGQPVGGLNSCNNGWDKVFDAPTFYNMKKDNDDIVIGVSSGNMLKICDARMGLSVNQKTGRISKLFFQDKGAYDKFGFHSGPIKQLFNSFTCEDNSEVPSFPWSRNMVEHFVTPLHAKKITDYFDFIRDYQKAHPEAIPQGAAPEPSEDDGGASH
jgi:hypothetical protein